MNIISTWFYTSPIGEKIGYAQMKQKSDSKAFHTVYWKNICCFFSMAHKSNPDARLLLFVNTPPPIQIGKLNLLDFLEQH